MLPPALFKTGDFVISKRTQVILKVLKSWAEIETVGIMAGLPKGYYYQVEDGRGKRFTMRESLLTSSDDMLVEDSSAKAVKPSPLPANGIKSSSQSANGVKSSPESANEVKSSPQSAYWVKSSPQSANGVKSSPQSANWVKSSPQSTNWVKSSPQSANCVKSSPQSANCVKSSPQSANCVKSSPQSANCVKSSPQSANCVKSSPQSANCVKSSPQSANGAKSSPQSANGAKSSPQSPIDVKPSQLSANTVKLTQRSNQIQSESSCKAKEETWEDLVFDPEEDLTLSQYFDDIEAFDDIDAYDAMIKSKQLPIKGKRKCFTLSPPPAKKDFSLPAAKKSLDSFLSAQCTNSSVISSSNNVKTNSTQEFVNNSNTSSGFSMLTSNISHLSANSPVTSKISNLSAISGNSTLTSNIFQSASFGNSTLTSNIPRLSEISGNSTITSNTESDVSVDSMENSQEDSLYNSPPPPPDIDKNLMPPPKNASKKSFLTKEQRAMKTKNKYIEPKDSKRKTNAIVKAFESYRQERGEKRPLKEIEPSNLDEQLASFWADRVKPDGSIPDVPTIHSQCSRLAAYLTRETTYNPTTHPAFVEYRKTKTAKLKQSKQVLGNGQLNNQSDALDSEEISFFFECGLINYASGPGITRMLYVTYMITLNFRAVKDHMCLKWGNLKIVRNSAGLIEYAYFVSQFSKTDDGSERGISRRGIIPPSATRSTCFFTYYEVLVRMRAMLGPEFLEPESPMYLQPRVDGIDYVKTNNICFFKPEPIKEGFLTNLVQNMGIAAEIEPGGRKITDTSLRITSFHAQEDLGIDSQTGQSISGHVSKDTCSTYRRKHQQRLNQMGAGLMSTMTGVPSVIPLTHGEKFQIKKNQPITIVDTTSTLTDFTPQLLSMRRLQQSTSFKNGDKFSGGKVLEAQIIQLDVNKPQEETQNNLASLVATKSSDKSLTSLELLPVNNTKLVENFGATTFTVGDNGTLSEESFSSTESLPDDMNSVALSDERNMEFTLDEENMEFLEPVTAEKNIESVLVDRLESSETVTGERNMASMLVKRPIYTNSAANTIGDPSRINLPIHKHSSPSKNGNKPFRLTENDELLKSNMKLSPGSLVFCKLKGHKDPHWPSRITTMANSSFTVQFFGTTQIATVPRINVENGLLVPLSVNSLNKFSNPANLKPPKKKKFGTGMQKMIAASDASKDLKTLQPTQNVSATDFKSVKKWPRGKKKKSGKENRPENSSVDDDLEDFVI